MSMRLFLVLIRLLELLFGVRYRERLTDSGYEQFFGTYRLTQLFAPIWEWMYVKNVSSVRLPIFLMVASWTPRCRLAKTYALARCGARHHALLLLLLLLLQ